MNLIIEHTTLLTPEETIADGTVVVEAGRIVYAGPQGQANIPDGRIPDAIHLDVDGRFTAPGFIDIHTHGGQGVAFGEGRQPGEELRKYSTWVASTGVTGFLCSLAAPDVASLVQTVKTYVAVFEAGLPGAQPLGIHLEGPYLNPRKKGAFNPAWLRKPSLEETKAVLAAGQGWIRQMTLAPELPGATEVARYLRQARVVAALGHTDADYELASQALRGDFRHVTHTFNAQSGFHHRAPGVFGAVLASDEVTAELIADGIHAHPGAMKVLLRCLGSPRVVLITDAMAGAGLADGEYDLVGSRVTVRNGHANLPDGTIAGSTATMDQCVRNAHQLAGAPLAEAVTMASLSPARILGLSDERGRLAPGCAADLVVFDADVNIYLTIVQGQVVYRSI